MSYARDGKGSLRCLVCGAENVGRADYAVRGHERGNRHKKAMANQPILYPNAVWKPLTGHSAPGTFGQRNLIVLHITGGSTMDGAFQTFLTSVAPKRVSAHFIIDRDGTIYQLLSLDETAWHAASVNLHSIGIEHVAIPVKLMATEEQYTASALLVRWLCGHLGIPVDRAHVREHCEASPGDNHPLCCHASLDIDRVVSLSAAMPADSAGG